MTRDTFFSDLNPELFVDPEIASEAIFEFFNDTPTDIIAAKNRDNYIKSIYKQTGYRKEINIDNTVLASFFAVDESATSKVKRNYNSSDEEKLIEIRFIIHNLLPDFERDIMTLIFDYNKIQEDIGVILGLSQEMVNYYKKRAIHRILHFYHHRKIDVNDMQECLHQYMSKRQLEAMMLYFFKHNQRIVSKELGISQSAVSARLKQGLKKLKKKSRHDERVAKYYRIFDNLTKQKSLYSSQTRMQVITEVNNYTQFDENNQRLKHANFQQPNKKQKQKYVKKELQSVKIKPHRPKKVKKIKFNNKKLKSLRDFFKR